MACTVVIADDDMQYRFIIRSLLRPLGETVRVVGEAEDGEAALAIVRRERPDVVIADVVMPRLNGVELTQHLREASPQTRVVLISAFTAAEYRVMVADSGADAFLNKQVLSSALLSAIRDVMRRAPRRRLELEGSSEG